MVGTIASLYSLNQGNYKQEVYCIRVFLRIVPAKSAKWTPHCICDAIRESRQVTQVICLTIDRSSESGLLNVRLRDELSECVLHKPFKSILR